MTTDIEKLIKARHAFHGMEIVSAIYMPTWADRPLKGWRRFLNAWFRVPLKWFDVKRDRVFYLLDGRVYCSPENYQWLNGIVH